MGDRNIKKETKKMKKTDKKPAVISLSTAPRPVVVQPELIKKVRKPK
ncbi:MAG: hypothetical protein RSE54_05865 [Ruthenibacterium sp.]